MTITEALEKAAILNQRPDQHIAILLRSRFDKIAHAIYQRNLTACGFDVLPEYSTNPMETSRMCRTCSKWLAKRVPNGSNA